MHERLVDLLLSTYRGSTRSESSDEQDENDPAALVCPPGCRPVRKRKRRDDPIGAFSDSEMSAALSAMSLQKSQDLEHADFAPFGRKLSWQQLAQGCISRLASDLLQLHDVPRAAEWADLLHHSLEARRSASVRTTTQTQDAIHTLFSMGVRVSPVERLRDGACVADTIGALGRASVVKRRWEAAAALAPIVRPRTSSLVRLVRDAAGSVLRGSASAGTKVAAQRLQNQWASRPSPSPSQGERVVWDSD